jgi:two-component system OmpR family response regulator
VCVANNGAGLREAIERDPVDLVILDLMLGGEDGLQLAHQLREKYKSEIGIIILTGRGDTVDRIIGLEMGADDYLTKPFHPRELLARVRSVSRRMASRMAERTGADKGSVVQFAGWSLDLARRALTSPAGDEVRLTTGEFELLDAFVNHPNQVLRRDQLLDLSRHRIAGPFGRTIDVQVGRLRRKLGDDPKNPMLIKTARGGGYMFSLLEI